jgi:tRNA-dihydrouridine synthase A
MDAAETSPARGHADGLAVPLSVAPMMDWTDRHCRYFLRQISRRVLLYTEMITAAAVLHGDRSRLLAYHPEEHPVAIQLGGNDPQALAAAARIAVDYGYDEVNLNIGCPSDRVRAGRFGACLMAEPDLVARCVAAMRRAVSVPVTVKSRIAIDDQPEWPTLSNFITTVADAGCTRFIVHARKAWLKGLNPKENREMPPLRHDLVHRLKVERPDLFIVVNGGIETAEQISDHLAQVDGVMLGRAAYRNPYLLAGFDRQFFGDASLPPSRAAVLERMIPYIEAECAQGTPLTAITRHILGLYQGVPGARRWRRHLSETVHRDGAGAVVVRTALAWGDPPSLATI